VTHPTPPPLRAGPAQRTVLPSRVIEPPGSVRNGRTLKGEVTLNACAIEWVFRVSQNDGIHDLVPGNLGGEKCAPLLKIRVRELHEPTAGHHLRPFVFHGGSFKWQVVLVSVAF
jgi:hypothetical protein